MRVHPAGIDARNLRERQRDHGHRRVVRERQQLFAREDGGKRRRIVIFRVGKGQPVTGEAFFRRLAFRLCDRAPELFEQHGKTINFVGVIITNENVYLADKKRSSDWSAKMAEYFGVDAVVITEEGFGNPDTDLMMNCTKIEAKGIKTVLVTDEYCGQDGKSQSLADSNPAADACVTAGNANQVVVLPAMDKVIGTLDYVNKIAGGNENSLRPDGSIEAEIQVITGATSEVGYNLLSAR